ncbi:MAG: hypothetical protein Q7V62_14510, partial [Actinomycetota bacterium]|nr:hypothetical protein [Actinomycetota bacterium]
GVAAVGTGAAVAVVVPAAATVVLVVVAAAVVATAVVAATELSGGAVTVGTGSSPLPGSLHATITSAALATCHHALESLTPY